MNKFERQDEWRKKSVCIWIFVLLRYPVLYIYEKLVPVVLTARRNDEQSFEDS